jgi:DNA invertase Pin-like site-specific DNA recombinase
MLVGYVRVSPSDDRQSTDLQRDALLSAVSMRGTSMKTGHPAPATTGLGWLPVSNTSTLTTSWWFGNSTASGVRCRTWSISSTICESGGIGFRSLTEVIDTTTAMGEFLFHVFGALAQYERTLIRERVLAGLKAAKRRGRVGGRPRKLDAERIDTAKALLLTGMTVSAAARAVGVPRSTLVDSLCQASASDSLAASRPAIETSKA